MSDRKHERVLLLATAGPDDRKTVSVVRSLGRSGYRVTLAGNSFRARGFHSRYARERVQLPHPEPDVSRFLGALRKLATTGSFDVVIPTGELTTFVLSQHQADLPELRRIPVAPADATAICMDKQRTAAFASELGLRSPPTFYPEDRKQLIEVAGKVGYPCVLKPRITTSAVGMSVPSNPEELLAAYDALPEFVSRTFDFRRPLVQERLAGEVHDVCALFNRGEPRALLTQRRIRMQPASGGAGIYNETTDEPDLKDLAVRLLSALQWHGPAQVEFLREEGSGTPYLIEVNGRFWGTLDLAVAAGMDFPALTCRMGIDGDVAPQSGYRVGLRCRWPYPFGLLHLMETGDWRGTARDFLLPRRHTCSDLVVTDPLPLIMDFLYTLRRFSGNGFRTQRRNNAWKQIAQGLR